MEEINIRSEEVNEILGTPPRWMVNYGIILAVIFFALLFILASIISYPDSQSGDITINFTDPPKEVVATKSGRIEEIFIRNSQKVEKDQVLMVYKSRANFEHILHLQALLGEIDNDNDSMIIHFIPPSNLQLDEVQENFSKFLDKREQFSLKETRFSADGNISSYRNQIESLRKSIGYTNRAKNITHEQIDAALKEKNNLERKVANGEAAQADINKVTREIRDLRAEAQKADEEIARYNRDIESLRNRISLAKQDDDQDRFRISNDIKASFLELKDEANQWVNQNIIFSPIEGIVEIDAAIGEQQYVRDQDPLFRVIPTQNRRLIGKMALDFQNSGQVQRHDRVNIRLKKYPFEEYGAIRGRVSWKASVPDRDNEVQIEISFPDGLTTTTGFQIDTEEALFGEGQIITEDKVLIGRIFNYGKSIWSSL